MKFKVDKAEVSAMYVSAWQSLHAVPQLHATKKVLGGPGCKPLPVVRVVTLPLSFEGKSCSQQV